MIIAHELKHLDVRRDAPWSVAHFADGSVCGLPTAALPDCVEPGAVVLLVLYREQLVAASIDGQWVVDMDANEQLLEPQPQAKPVDAPQPTEPGELQQLWRVVRQAARSTVRARLQRWAADL